MKRIVVTGSKGGTGHSLVAVLRDAGYEVLGIDIKPPEPFGEADYIQLDLRDAAGVNDAFGGADAVVHFGSVPGDANRTTSEAFHMLTVAGFNVFQAAKNVGIKRIAWASSIEVYGDFRKHPMLPVTEESLLAPPGIYGTSKLLLERLAVDYCRWYGMSIAGFRLSRIIYDDPQGYSKLREIVDDEPWGWDCLWSYIDARDVATACQAWLESDHQGAEQFNLAAANVHQDKPIAQLLESHGYRDVPAGKLESEESTPFSTDKIRAILDWQARYDWREILRAAVT
jgi:nucleoside-diphosphate-sugar epimerase